MPHRECRSSANPRVTMISELNNPLLDARVIGHIESCRDKRLSNYMRIPGREPALGLNYRNRL